ncbi:MAG: phospho-sugar mutase [Candidatus Methylacidiphilales bacterium]|nr:phospho-sugar mutase [Candidatus Methylacidiphilales bacterium]
MTSLSDLLAAVPAGALLPSTVENIIAVHSSPSTPDWARASIEELVTGEAWTELNDRFYKNLAFGTGGIRGRTIGRVVTGVERGAPQPLGRPEHAAAGSNMLNAANIRRAAQGLGQYLKLTYPNQPISVVVAHDTRHFSPDMAQVVATAVAELGIQPYLFSAERSTPQLSYTVRWLKAQAGVVITASHNPPHDNGFKAYWADGGQLVEPFASGVITEVNKIAANPLPAPAGTIPQTIILGADADAAYLEAVSNLVLEPEAIAKAKADLKLVFTPLHGTGIQIIPALLDKFGFNYSIVEAQRTGDGRFPTVQSPNPENAEALKLGIDQANAENASAVLATDPDADRMGVAVRDRSGQMVLLTGNMIGSICAYYRAERFFAKGILNDSNRHRATLIKTFVTTDLQARIAEHFGIKIINTLTGFKYIGEKLRDYELLTGLENYDAQPYETRRAAQLERGTFFVFGGEESYGYSGADYVRDKDANAATLMFAEALAWAHVNGQTLVEYLDDIYRKFGFYTEKLGTLTFEGAAGAMQIKKLLASYRSTPPVTFIGESVVRVEDFGLQDFVDVDGKAIPKETMLIFHLQSGSRMAVRGSGTEPKIKFYFFATAPGTGDLDATKLAVRAALDQWWTEVQADVQVRIA